MSCNNELKTYDLLYWMKENSPTAIPLTFSHANLLGYPCTVVNTLDGSLSYWQNLCLKVDTEDPFEVTSLTVLDEMTEK